MRRYYVVVRREVVHDEQALIEVEALNYREASVRANKWLNKIAVDPTLPRPNFVQTTRPEEDSCYTVEAILPSDNLDRLRGYPDPSLDITPKSCS